MTTPSKADVIFIGIFAAVFFLSGVGILGFQVIEFLFSGEWKGVSTINLISIATDNPWLYHPQSWLGLHKILNHIPASIALFAVGYFILTANE